MVVAVIPRVFLCFRVQVSEIEGHSEREREREREGGFRQLHNLQPFLLMLVQWACEAPVASCDIRGFSCMMVLRLFFILRSSRTI